MLYFTALYCSVPYCHFCTVLQCILLSTYCSYCNFCAVLYCTVLLRTILSFLYCTAVYSTLSTYCSYCNFCAVLYCTVLLRTILSFLYCTAVYCTHGRSHKGCKGYCIRQAFSLSENFQYTISASRCWIARKAFFIGKFGLREVFFICKLGLVYPQLPLSTPQTQGCAHGGTGGGKGPELGLGLYIVKLARKMIKKSVMPQES